MKYVCYLTQCILRYPGVISPFITKNNVNNNIINLKKYAHKQRSTINHL